MKNKENIDITQYHVQCDIAYDTQSPAQTLDLYYPDAQSDVYPLIFHVHGGAFYKGDKQDHQLRPYLTFLQEGFAVASINYRLSKEACFPAAVLDARKALRFLRTNAAQFHMDANHIAAVGGSAGGNIIEMLCCAQHAPYFLALEDKSDMSCGVQCGVAWFAPTDFLQMDDAIRTNGIGTPNHNEKDSPESMYLGKQITHMKEEDVQRANPITYLHKDIPWMLLQHGRCDRTVPWQQSQLFYEKAKTLSVTTCEFQILEDADHADERFETKENMEKVIAFIKTHI